MASISFQSGTAAESRVTRTAAMGRAVQAKSMWRWNGEAAAAAGAE